MRTIPFALAATLALTGNLAWAASSGTVTINGEVTEQTCEIASGSENITVNLVKVPTTTLVTNGQTAALQPFNIELKDCSAGNVFVKFSPQTAGSVDLASGTLINTSTDPDGVATNVNIALYEKGKSTPIKIGDESYTYDSVTIPEGEPQNVTLNYAAAYYALAQSTAGKVKAVADFTVAYQ